MVSEVGDNDKKLKDKVVEVLKNVYDPEIPINIWDLGLVYEVNVSCGVVYIKMTLTSPMCPIAYVIVQQVTDAVSKIEGVKDVKVDLVFDPPWDPTKMTEEGRRLFKKIYGYDIVEEFRKQPR
ncbi:MAG: metal-sulfur cluster assembly factor [Desulfurococcales archaeon]|nr:metal-sulfur cluster assembly factor [Desulfurococcales archaeon]RLG75693.1 MAG: FeS assembly SUF system protein [Thermoprotei archaeon]